MNDAERHPGVDEGTMLSWFANAIENGRRYEHRDEYAAAVKRAVEGTS